MENDNKQCMTFTFQNKCFWCETTNSFEMTVNVACVVVVYVCNHTHTHFKRINETMFDARIFWCVVFGRLLFFFSFVYFILLFLKIEWTWCFPRYTFGHTKIYHFNVNNISTFVKIVEWKFVTEFFKERYSFTFHLGRICDLFNDSILCY